MSKKKTSLSPDPLEDRFSEMNRFFRQAFSSPFFEEVRLPSPERAWKHAILPWPKLDVKETKTRYRITADVPGVEPKDLKVESDGHLLVIHGTTEKEREEKDEKRHLTERHSGSFYRSLTLPDDADMEHISASHKNGSLLIVVPKHATRKKKLKSVPVRKT